MKYMTFNNSCSYAGIANLLEEFNIDIEDEFSRENAINFLQNCKHKCMMALNIRVEYSHAVKETIKTI